jgi:cytolysin-activating lysine-acyltransferase
MSKTTTPEKPAAATAAAKAGAAPAAKAGGPAMSPRNARQARMAQSFSQVVAVLMRDQNFRNMRLADLEWLVIPPVMSGQFRVAHAAPRTADKPPQQPAGFVPVAVALWARVSPQIDKALSEGLDKPVWLRPNQWASGDILWLMAIAGDRRALPQFLKRLQEEEFKGQPVKMRARDANGKVTIQELAASVAKAASTSAKH